MTGVSIFRPGEHIFRRGKESRQGHFMSGGFLFMPIPSGNKETREDSVDAIAVKLQRINAFMPSLGPRAVT